jgi:CDP-diacylglycerol--serine O-phosphatidyltransferase
MQMKKRIHLLPNVITAFALMCGLFAIFKLNMTAAGEATEHVLRITAGLILLAALFDLLDGAIARAIKAESEFGGIFDSMADAVSFGVAPTVIILKTISAIPGTFMSFLITTAAVVYSVCGILRLVRYNVNSNQIKGNEDLEAANKQNFTGLPIPAAATAALSLNMILFTPDVSFLFNLSEMFKTIVLFFGLTLLGYFMVSRWKFPSSKRLQIRVGSFPIVILCVILAVTVFYGLFYHTALVFFCIAWGYVLIALVLSFIRVIAMRKTHNLEDFEPDSEDIFDDVD